MTKRKICIATNIFNIDPVPYASHMSMWYRIGKNLPEWDVIFAGPWRMPIDVARNKACEIALDAECEYLFFYDDDMVMDPDIVEKLLKRVEKKEIHIIAGLCYIRGYPYAPMIFRFRDSDKLGLFEYTEDDIKDGLVSIDATGCACTMIDCELLRLTPKPWFVTGIENHTEDVYFMTKVKDYVEGVKIYLDTETECGHMLDKPILNTTSRKLLTKLHDEGVDQLWQPDITIRTTKGEAIFSEDDFNVNPVNPD